MLKKIRSILKWIWWNLANIISIGRAVGIFWAFFITDYNDDLKLLIYICLLPTDKLDGWVARLIKNTKGIGKIIDPSSDKADKIMFLVFLRNSEFMNEGIINLTAIKAIFSGEVLILSIVIWGIYISIEHQKSRARQEAMPGNRYKQIYRNSMEDILKKWKVELIGKAVMVAYGAMVLMLYMHKNAIWREDITELLGVSALIVGLSARAVSIVIYFINVYKGQKEMLGGG